MKLFENIAMTRRSPKGYVSLMAASILYSLNIMTIFDQLDISVYLNRLRRAIMGWLVDYNVIGPFMFGGSHENQWKGKLELEVKYLTINFYTVTANNALHADLG